MTDDPRQQSRLVTWLGHDVFVEALQRHRFATGLDMLRAMQDGVLPRPPIAATLDYRPARFEAGRAVFTCTPQSFHYNPLGVAHGGLAATLLDTAMACAIHTKLPIDVSYTTLELKVNFVRAMTEKTGPVEAIGELLHLGGRTATADGRIVDAQGRLLAHGTTTCLVLR